MVLPLRCGNFSAPNALRIPLDFHFTRGFERAMSELDELKRMIRIGWSLNDSPAFVANGMSHELQDEIQRTIDSIRDDLVPTFDVNQRVTFLTLSSEFEYAFGIQDRQAISQLGDTLATYGVTRQLAEWKTARSTPWLKLERWPEPGQTWIASATNDQERAELMRRQIWALMAVAFYGQFVDGHIDSAIDDLRKIETIIRSELRPLWHGKSYGSQERCNEFLAQAHRTRGESGDYEESEKRFSMAQEFADLRLSQAAVIFWAWRLSFFLDAISSAPYLPIGHFPALRK